MSWCCIKSHNKGARECKYWRLNNSCEEVKQRPPRSQHNKRLTQKITEQVSRKRHAVYDSGGVHIVELSGKSIGWLAIEKTECREKLKTNNLLFLENSVRALRRHVYEISIPHKKTLTCASFCNDLHQQIAGEVICAAVGTKQFSALGSNGNNNFWWRVLSPVHPQMIMIFDWCLNAERIIQQWFIVGYIELIQKRASD